MKEDFDSIDEKLASFQRLSFMKIKLLADYVMTGHNLTRKELKTMNLNVDEMIDKQSAIEEKLLVCLCNQQRKFDHPVQEILLMVFSLTKIASFLSVKAGFPLEIAEESLKNEYDEATQFLK